MRKMRFEEDECLVITMFEEKTREKAVQTIKTAKKQMDSKDMELMELMDHVLEKLSLLSDEAYRQFDFDSYRMELEDTGDED